MFIKQIKGNIINIGSNSGLIVDRPQPQASYNASKAAVHQLTKSLACEWAPYRIRVNAIAPGFFLGNQNKDLLLNKDGSYTQRGNTIINNTPMKRFGKAEELNGAIHFLCSDASSFITGVVLPIDGGFSAFSGV